VDASGAYALSVSEHPAEQAEGAPVEPVPAGEAATNKHRPLSPLVVRCVVLALIVAAATTGAVLAASGSSKHRLADPCHLLPAADVYLLTLQRVVTVDRSDDNAANPIRTCVYHLPLGSAVYFEVMTPNYFHRLVDLSREAAWGRRFGVYRLEGVLSPGPAGSLGLSMHALRRGMILRMTVAYGPLLQMDVPWVRLHELVAETNALDDASARAAGRVPASFGN